jgi:hypothetical protein
VSFTKYLMVMMSTWLVVALATLVTGIEVSAGEAPNSPAVEAPSVVDLLDADGVSAGATSDGESISLPVAPGHQSIEQLIREDFLAHGGNPNVVFCSISPDEGVVFPASPYGYPEMRMQPVEGAYHVEICPQPTEEEITQEIAGNTVYDVEQAEAMAEFIAGGGNPDDLVWDFKGCDYVAESGSMDEWIQSNFTESLCEVGS